MSRASHDEINHVPKADIVQGTYYRDRRAGCFQHFVTVPEHTVLPLPPNLSMEQAATLGVAGLTAAMTLWHWLQVPIPASLSSSTIASTTPPQGSDYLLLWGGATTTGQYLTQLATLAHMKTIVVASAKTETLCRSRGAAHVVVRDGKSDAELVAEIRHASSNGRITRVVDLVGPKTAALCLQAVAVSSSASAGVEHEQEHAEVLFAPLAMMDATDAAQAPAANVRILTVEMKQFVLKQECAVYARKLNELVGRGVLKPPEVEVLEGGLELVEEGLRRVKMGERGGRKLVVRL